VRNSDGFEYTFGLFKKKALYIYTVSRYSAILKDINMSKAHTGYEHVLKVLIEDLKIYKAFFIMPSDVYGQVKR